MDDQYPLSHARLAETYIEINSLEKRRRRCCAPYHSRLIRKLAVADGAYLEAVAATVEEILPLPLVTTKRSWTRRQKGAG